MNTLARWGRSVRKTLSGLGLAGTPAQAEAHGPGPVARAAGRALGRRAQAGSFSEQFEQLEARQLLFTLTVGPGDVNPATGLGTVSANFLYALPTFRSPIRQQVQPIVIDENFDDENAQWTTFVPAVPPVGTFFNQSNIQVSYAGTGTPVQLVTLPGNGQGQADKILRIALTGAAQATFSVFSGNGTNLAPALTTSLTVTISQRAPGGDGDGLKTDLNGTKVDLLRDGQIVQTLSGQALAAVGTNGQNGFSFFTFALAAGFDSIRFSSANTDTTSYADTFTIERIQTQLPGGEFAQDISNRTVGATLRFTAPVGASVQVVDLYGRDLEQGLNTLNLFDRNDDGVPDRNDGIGRIIIQGANTSSSLTLLGFIPSQQPFDQWYPTGVDGFDFGALGFGYAFSRQPTNPPTVLGLPPGPASLIVGSPFVRDLTNAPSYRGDITAQVNNTDNFNRPDQGIFVTGSFGSVNIHGVVYGSSVVTGAIDRFAVGVMQGSLRVDGDLGLYSVAGDAGVWFNPEDSTVAPGSYPVNLTASRLSVGRTMREASVAGRNFVSISVLGDVNSSTRARLNFREFSSSEAIFGYDPAVNDGVRVGMRDRWLNLGGDYTGRTNGNAQPVFYGLGYLRNDDINSAEYVGYNGTQVRIFGRLNGQDSVNTAADSADVYAFPADSTREIVVSLGGSTNGALGGFTNALGLGFGYARIVDRDGRVVAALDTGGAGRGEAGNAAASRLIRFRPDRADTYYLVINVSPNGPGTGLAYTVNIDGMAPVTVGSIRSGAGMSGGAGSNQSISVSAGSVGIIRVGTGYIGGDGGQSDPAETFFSNQGVGGYLRWRTSTISVPGTLYSVYTGADIDGAQLLIGGDLGSFTTGQALIAGVNVLNGDLFNADIRVGGRIGLLDIKGAIAADQIPDPTFDNLSGTVTIVTGTSGRRGDIGQILVGAYINGRGLTINTSPGSQIDQFLVGTNNGGAGSEYPGQIRGGQPVITLGAGSDIRFTDFSLIQRPGDADVTTNLAYGQSITFVDDAGASFTVSISGGQAGTTAAPGPALNSFATLRVLPINGSRGVALSRVQAVLRGGANLVITSTSPGVVSIGRLIVDADLGDAGQPTPGVPTPNSSLLFSGPAQIDIGRIDVVAGQLEAITNSTVGGDIVAIDTLGLRTLTLNGSLGRTQVSGAGTNLLGPFLGLAAGRTGAVGGPLGITAGVNGAADWNGSILLPVGTTDYTTPNSLEDVGSPIDGYLNGLVVRAGDLTNVNVTGTVGDVIVEQGDVITVTANSDASTPQGGFEGIEGSIYARRVGTVDIGDGLRGTGPSPFAAAGIFADDIISLVTSTRINGAQIQGAIIAGGNAGVVTTIGTVTAQNLPAPTSGIGTIQLTNGRYDGAYIHAGDLDDFWGSLRVRDQTVYRGTVLAVRGNTADLFRSEIGAVRVEEVTLTGGAWDATALNVTDSVGAIIADEYRNSTRLGASAEFFTSRITATNNVASVTTNGLSGDVADLTVDAGGSLTGQLAGRNVVRSSLQIANVTQSVRATQDVKSTTIISGNLVSLSAGQNIRSSSLRIAGPIQSVTAGDQITLLEAISSGPDGRVDTITAQNLLQANVSSSGAIGTIRSIANDVQGSIETRNEEIRANNGGLTLLQAGRDLLVSLSILGNTQTITAGRNVGTINASNPSLDLRSDLGNLTVGGQIYSDLLVGQSVTGSITTGRVFMLPGNDLVSRSGILVFGRINALVFNSDVAGPIVSRSGGIGTITFNSASLRPDGSITVNNGDLGTLVFNGGDLMGDVNVDGNITAVNVLVGSDGFKGNIGVTSFKFNSTRFDAFRNELPPDVFRTAGRDGVTIKAGGSIGRVFVQQGSIWESQIIAGTTIDEVNVALQFRNDVITIGLNNAIVAGERIGTVIIGGFVGGLAILAGVTDLGADGLVGGTGADRDTVGSGSIGTITLDRKRAVNSVIAAGIAPDDAGNYNTSGSKLTEGRSSIGTITIPAGVVGVSAFSDGPLGATSSGIVRGGTGLSAQDPSLLAPPSSATAQESERPRNTDFQITLLSGERVRVLLSGGAGRIFWDRTIGRLRLLNTNAGTSLTITALDGTITDLTVLGNPGAQLNTLTITGTLRGNSTVVLDNTIGTVNLDTLNTSGRVGAGGNITTFNVGRVIAGTLIGRVVGTLAVRGDFGRVDVPADAFARFLGVTNVNVTGAIAGAISSDRTIGAVTAASINTGGIRSGGSITSVTTGFMRQGRVAARNAVGTVTVNGDVDESQILGGVDLGRDADYGGTGGDSDFVGNGSVNAVNVTGNFRKSDISVGVLRGPGGFFGFDDVIAAAGRGSIGTVTIGGTQTGSSLNSEQYRIISTGTIGTVTVGGLPFTANGNFRLERRAAVAVPVRVLDLSVSEDSRVYTASITFNQQIDVSTLGAALSVFEIRNGGVQTIGLAEGVDYLIRYDRATSTARIIFSRSVTERSLPQLAGVPGPGVYQISLNANILRGSTQDSLLDGDGNGAGGDDFSRNIIVGDAGDKITAGTPTSRPSISFYGAADLDLILRTSATVGGLPETNQPFKLTGTVGDHPNSDPDFFRLGGDVDVYRVTLRAGQVLRLGEVTGVGLGVIRGLYSASGVLIGSDSQAAGSGAALLSVASNAAVLPGATGEAQYLVKTTGTYYVVVSGDLGNVNISDVDAINNADPVPGAFGRYSFDITVLDDENGGFIGDTASGTGAALVTPPTPIVFAGFDGVFGTRDDRSSFVDGDWTFTLQRGTSSPGGRDAVVRGVNSQGWTVTRTSAPDGSFGSANDRIAYSVQSSIGLPGGSGVPVEVSPDVDVYRLNNGNPIAPGTRIRATLRLSATGSNIGLSPEVEARDVRGLVSAGQDLSGQALFSLFEIPAGTGFDDAKLVASPSDFLPIGGQAQRTVTDGRTSYGYDASGDFFMEFVIPGAQGVSTAVPASYALYIQGAIRSDYTLEVVQQGTGTTTPRAQNVLLESLGGTINWLEAGRGITTRLSPFAASVLGFSAQVNNQDVNTYILNSLVSNLNTLFASAGVAINISLTANTFQRQDFSTVFIAGNVEPSAFFGNGTFGASQHVDAFNADQNDQAVVFASSLAGIGFEPSQQGVDRFVSSLTAAVGRRIGELVGVRFETNIGVATSPVEIMAADSPTRIPTGVYAFTNTTRALATIGDNATDTVFYLGSQNSGQLISKLVLPRP